MQEEVKQSRYERLTETLKDIQENKKDRCHSYYDKHYDVLCDYRDNFTNFDSIDHEIQDSEFRKKACIVENLLTKLMKEYESFRWFCLYDYERLNQNLIWMSSFSRDFHINQDNDNELSSLLVNLMKV